MVSASDVGTTARPGVAGAAGRASATLRRRAGTSVRRVVRGWRRSLRLRVVTTTVVLSLLVVALLATYLSNRIAAGLIDTKLEAALAEAAGGTRVAQEAFDASPADDPAEVVKLAAEQVARLAGADGPAGHNESSSCAPRGDLERRE
jgi:two-component system sensor histidine kinase MtrB